MKAARLTALLAMLAAVAQPAVAATAREMYELALTRERVLRSADATPTLARFRSAVGAFEAVVRRHPASGYADNALWEGAQVAAEAAERFDSARDRETAIRLLTLLVEEYPSSSLRTRAKDQLKDLTAVVKPRAALPAAVRGTPAASKASPDRRAARTAAVAPEAQADDSPAPGNAARGGDATAGDPAGAQVASLSMLREVRRTVVNDVVRVTIELSDEVIYRSERVESPPRVFFDLAASRLGPALAEGTLSFSGDIVRHIRIGRHPNRVTRVVIDLEGVKRYTVFTLYSPYRIVVDCEPDRAAALPLERETVHDETVKLPPPPPPDPPPALDSHAVDARLSTKTLLPAIVSNRTPVVAVPAVVTPPLRPTRDFAPHYRRLGAIQPSVRLPAPLVPPVTSVPRRVEMTPAPSTPPAAVPAISLPAVPPSVAPAATRPSTAPTPAVADGERAGGAPASAPPAPPAPGSRGYSLARQLGLGASRIVIDPGHGGHDPGAEGPGTFEANVVLDVALRLERLLVATGSEVVLTRRSDEYIPLEERTAIANRAQGDLFLSIHANASRNRAARGVESYFLNFATSPDAEAVAARENASTGRTMSSLTDIVKAITLNNKLNESKSFAALVQRQMVEHLQGSNKGLRDHGVKQAPFVVLIGASMPSVLVEISFITNSQEGRLLKSGSYRQKVAEALADAIRGYQKSLKNTTLVTHQ